jgi:DNA processing protein
MPLPAARSDAVDLDSLHSLIALSLAPVSVRRAAAECLRCGRSPEPLLWPLDNASALRHEAHAALARGRTAGLHALGLSDPAYPAMLSAIIDPPLVLWVRGDPSSLDIPAVAIVGSRGGSDYALTVAERLAVDLARRGVAVVSGLARGVDSAAHRGALEGDGITIGVLGCGADVMYPAEHRALAARMTARGAVISELVPGTAPQQFFFPMRNRIISGLSRAVVVIEAGARSGSLITARCALDQGRDVMAVPGNVLNGRNLGGHALLRDGAKIVETADDILEELGVGRSVPGVGRDGAHGGGPPPADPVLACLTPGEPSDLDAIAMASGLPVPQLLPRLFELELQGFVGRAGGGRFVRFDRTC